MNTLTTLKLYFPLFFAGLLIVAACSTSGKEIPSPVMVRIWYRMQEDSVFRTTYAKPEKAPDSEIEPFTSVYGFKPADFKKTIRKMEQNESFRREFEQHRRAYVDSLALETLKEISDNDTLPIR